MRFCSSPVILELMIDTILADRMGQMDESVTLALNARAKQMAKDGKPSIT